MSESIITINVGGQIFMAHISTLTKFPESMLATMFNHQNQGMAPMTKTNDGVYFLDANPLHFGEILDYLRYGELVTEDSNLLKGVKKLANYLGLTELVKELGSREEDELVKELGSREENDDWVTLDLDGKKEIKMSLKTLTRRKSSTLAKYFLGDKKAKDKLSEWIKKENETRYFIGRPLATCEVLFQFLRSNQNYGFVINKEIPRLDFQAELELFGLDGYVENRLS